VTLARWASGLGALALAAALAQTAPGPSRAAAGPPAPPRVPAAAWTLVDAGDGDRLAAANPDDSRAMASTTKLMTAYLALRELSLDQRLVAPLYDPLPGESLLGLTPGERVSVRDLLYGLLMASGNDAAVTLADGVSGSVPAFVEKMNDAARGLGLNETSYANPIGLDDPGNYSSPRDLVRLALDLRRNRLFRGIVDTARTTLESGTHPRTVVNRNDLVATVPWVNGVKTGYTPQAGDVLVASGTRKGITLISAVMGAPTEAARDNATMSLLRYGFSLYHPTTAVERGERVGAVPVANADARLALIAARRVSATVRRGQRVEVDPQVPSNVSAPVARGDRIGTALVTVDGERLAKVAVLASRDLEPSSGGSVMSRVDDALPGPRGVAWAGIGGACAIVIGIVIALTRRRQSQSPGQRGRGEVAQ
jgi:serine-type D-Ala-D-Ala carboxypeptidase (penicillin-binding protein 5/6)